MTTRAKLHTAWASVLIDTTLTGTIVLSRNGVRVATLVPGQAVFYDHFPPLGVALTYVADNGSTSESVGITVPTHPEHKTWLKSAVDPNWSLAVTQRPLGDVDYAPRVGVYRLAPDGSESSVPWVAFGGAASWRTELSVQVEVSADRGRILSLLSGPVYVQPCPELDEPDRWVAVAGDFREARSQTEVPWWDYTIPLVEHPTPAADPARVIIPGWSWSDVAATWASWTAADAAAGINSWVDLVRYGVT